MLQNKRKTKRSNILRVITIFPKDSEAIFNKNSTRTFGGATVQMYLISKELGCRDDIECYSFITNYKQIDFEDEITISQSKSPKGSEH